MKLINIIFYLQVFSTDIYKLHFHDSMQELDEETLKFRKVREETLCHTIDQDLAEVLFSIKQSPDGQPITLLYTPLIKDSIFKHGFTTRFGGVSTWKTLSSLNLMFNPKRRDPRVNITGNRKRLALQCGYDFQKFYMAKCVHGNRVWVIGDPEPDSYDALLSNKPGVTIAAPGADCSILLFCDPVKKICAAAHSGWRGTLANISHEVLRVMGERFACDVKNICVAIGPTIGPCCFEVGEDVAEKFAAICSDVVVRKENKPKPFVDLRKTTRVLLEKYGILPENIDDGSRYSWFIIFMIIITIISSYWSTSLLLFNQKHDPS